MFQSNDLLKKHIVEIHENIVKDATQESLTELKEFSLCEDTFSTNEQFKSYVSDHLEEIKDIDI